MSLEDNGGTDIEVEMRKKLMELRPKLFSLAMKLTGGHVEDAENFVHDTLETAMVKIDQFQGGTNLGAWTNRILINKFKSYLKLSSTKKTATGEEADRAYETAIFDDDLERAVMRAEIAKLIEQLPPDQRETLIMSAKGMNNEEIAAVLGIAENTVSNRLVRARRKLRELLEEGKEKH